MLRLEAPEEEHGGGASLLVCCRLKRALKGGTRNARSIRGGSLIACDVGGSGIEGEELQSTIPLTPEL